MYSKYHLKTDKLNGLQHSNLTHLT